MELEQAKNVLDWVGVYGLGTVLSIVLVIGFLWILIYVLKQNTRREERLADLLSNNFVNIQDDLVQSKSTLAKHDLYFQELREASKFQRDEHKEIVNALQALQREIAGIR